MTTKLHFSTSENYSIRPHWSNSILQPCFLLSPSRNSWTQLSKNLQPKIYQHLVYSSYASVFHCRPSHHGWRQNVLLAVDTFLHRPPYPSPQQPQTNHHHQLHIQGQPSSDLMFFAWPSCHSYHHHLKVGPIHSGIFLHCCNPPHNLPPSWEAPTAVMGNSL